MINGHKYFDVRDKVEFEIYSFKPSWWMRNGIFFAFLILVLILCFGYLIEYPDRIYGEFRLSFNQPAITIQLPEGVQVDKVFKSNGSMLYKQDPILTFRSNTSYNDLLVVDSLLKETASTDSQFVAFFENVRHKRFLLGELQPFWMELYSRLFEHYTITIVQKFDTRIKRLNLQVEKQYQLDRKLKGLLKMNRKERAISNKHAFIDSLLLAQDVISTVDYLRKEEEYIIKHKGWQQQEISVKRNELDIITLVNTIDAVAEEKDESLLRVRFQITEAFSKLKAEIDNWKRKYEIESPIDGTLHYLSDIGENKFIIAGDNTIVITPHDQSIKAIVKIPLQGAGKVNKGQQVHFKLHDYPHREFGYLQGKLNFVSNVAGLNYYLGEVNLGKMLTTNYRKTIAIKENMSGVAEIIADDRNIMSRVLDRVLYIFRH